MLLTLLLLGCDPPEPSPPGAQTAKSSDGASIIKPERRTIRRTIEQPGTIQAFEETPLYAKVAGFVKEMRVDIGDQVKSGDLLAELLVPELDEELKQKVALVEQNQAEIKQAEAALAAADAYCQTTAAKVKEAEAGRASAEALVARWKGELQRLEKVSKTTLDPQTLEETRYQMRSAEAGRDEVEAKVLSARAAHDEALAKKAKAAADVSAAKARLGVAQAAERRVAALVSYTKIRAPYPGVITRRNVDTGAFLQPSPGSKGEALLVIMRQDKVRIYVDVPEMAVPFISKDTPAHVRVPALGGEIFAGAVTRTSWALDAKARTLRAEIDLPNPEGKLRPGMYSYATLVAERSGALTLPATALITQGDQTFCYRVADGKAVRTHVQTGLSGNGQVEVLRWQKPGKEGAWLDFTGREEIVATASSVTDGQSITAR